MYVFFIIEAKSENKPVYGLTRNVGQFKDESTDSIKSFDQQLIALHSTILGDQCELYPYKVKSLTYLKGKSSRDSL